jgi:predicted MFS family arabinose efflux permease
LLSRGLVGLGCGLIFGAAAAATVATDNPDRSFGIGQAIMNLLFLLLYLGSPYVIETFQYQGLVVLFGCLFLTFCPVFRALPDANTKIQIVDESKQSLDPIAVGVLVIATVCLNLGLGALWGYVELIGTSQVALTTRQVASVLSLTTIAMIAGSLMASWLSSTYGRGRPMCVASICCAISVLAVANATSITVYFGGLMLYNFAYLFISPYIFAGVSSTIDASGRLASVMIGTVFLSYSAGIALGGLIIETLGISAMGWFGFVGCLISAPMYYQLCLRLDS